MARFHLFTDLPKELRDEIWDMAIRDDKAAVHFFTIYDDYWDSDSVVNPAMKVHAARDPDITWTNIGFAAPRPRGSDQLSWTEGNVSTYMADSGLWTACHESRERMLRHFRPSETSPQLSKRMKVDWETADRICNRPTASVNMEFIRDNGERQYLTIRPSTDLICLQLPKNSNIEWSSRGHWEDIERFPLFRWHIHEPRGRKWSSSCIAHVAVEYDPAWENYDPRTSYGPFTGVTDGFSKVDEIHGLRTFWFIDYRLTRKYQSDHGEERQTFCAGNLTFIEVDASDYEWCCCPMGACSDGCAPDSYRHAKYGPHALIDDLELYNELQDNERSGYDSIEVHLGADMRVLACVDLKLEGKLPTREEWYEMNDYL